MSEILIVHGWANTIRAQAAALLVIQDFDRFQCIIFSWGKTGWPDLPSEAASMRTIFLKGIHMFVPKHDTRSLEKYILLEESSYDTESNAQSVLRILWISKKSHLTLLSSLSHLPRIESIYSRLGFRSIQTISAEWIFYDSNFWLYKVYILQYLSSYANIRTAWIELSLYILTQFVLGRRWIRSKTQWRIQNPPSK